MVVNLQDRRVQKTRRLFQEALIKLLQENRYSTIRIEDLADQANLGRTTFYLHYQDKDALLEECMIRVLSSTLRTRTWISRDRMALMKWRLTRISELRCRWPNWRWSTEV